jgi:winged helix DNA-binding protein
MVDKVMRRSEVLGFRVSAQQLDRPMAQRVLTDAEIFDFGVQDTGRDGASWALANRGVPLENSDVLESSPDVVLAWTLRGAPHFYRRDDLPDVLVATSPFSDSDAAKRVIGADKPLREDAVEVRIEGKTGWLLEGSVGSGHGNDLLRLLGGFDLFLQGKDRTLIVPDRARHKELWPVLGRPGAVLSGDEIIGTWRPKTASGRFTLRISLWTKITKAVRDLVETEAERLARHRGLTLAGIDEDL